MKNILLLLLLFTTVLTAQIFRLTRPVANKYQINGSYLYGEPRYGNSTLAHLGVDISIAYDTVFSCGSGIVTFVGYNPNDTIGGYEAGGAGNYITLKIPYQNTNLYILYMHLKRPIVAVNDTVWPGKPIAISGNTGNSTGPHCHFEIRYGVSSYSASRSRRNADLWISLPGMGAIYGKIPNAPNSTRVDITPDPKPRPPYTTFGYALSYNFNDPAIGSDNIYNENYAIGDVKPGTYTITALNGTYKRIVTVTAGAVVNADLATNIVDEIADYDFQLEQNYPNPFNPETKISFTLNKSDNVKLAVYDLLGNELAVLINDYKTEGTYIIPFNSGNINGRVLSSGTYFYRLITQDKVLTRKMVLIK